MCPANQDIYKRKHCGDCGVLEGQIHEDDCDMERCPLCGGQFIRCNCDPDEKSKNRTPYIQFPNICDYCGKLWPKIFRDDEWKSVLPEIYWKKRLCSDCWQYIKNLIKECDV